MFDIIGDRGDEGKELNLAALEENTKPFPRCVLMLIYLAVPVRLLCSLYGMCLLVSGSMYSLAKPKSIMCIIWFRLVECLPMRKFSGFTSRYMRLLLCTNSTLSSYKKKQQNNVISMSERIIKSCKFFAKKNVHQFHNLPAMVKKDISHLY